MTKQITIVDYEGNKKIVSVENFENVVSILVTVLSGDEVLKVFFKDVSSLSFDSSDCRLASYFDGNYILPLVRIDEFSEMEDSYDKMGFFAG